MATSSDGPSRFLLRLLGRRFVALVGLPLGLLHVAFGSLAEVGGLLRLRHFSSLMRLIELVRELVEVLRQLAGLLLQILLLSLLLRRWASALSASGSNLLLIASCLSANCSAFAASAGALASPGVCSSCLAN